MLLHLVLNSIKYSVEIFHEGLKLNPVFFPKRKVVPFNLLPMYFNYVSH